MKREFRSARLIVNRCRCSNRSESPTRSTITVSDWHGGADKMRFHLLPYGNGWHLGGASSRSIALA
jgi:hypothetical protein